MKWNYGKRAVAFTCLILLAGFFNPTAASDKGFSKEETAKFAAYVDGIAAKILNNAQKKDGALYWTDMNREGQAVESADFHNGTPGISYFLLKAYDATGKKEFLEGARKGMDTILRLGQSDDLGWYIGDKLNGLFVGNAGRGWLFLYAYHLTQEKSYLEAAEKLAARIVAAPSIEAGSGTDIFTGISGTGLFLLKLHEVTKNPAYLQGAEKLGDVLVERAEPQGQGVRWVSKGKENDSYFIGFAHGTLGRAYFLERLSQLSKKTTYRECADKAMVHLAGLAVAEKNFLKWPAEESRGMDKFPSQWCHGAPGMNALFFEVYKRTGDKKLIDYAEKNSLFVIEKGVNIRKNGCVCHGIAGNAAPLYMTFLETGNPVFLEETRKAVALLDETLIKDPDGLYWDSLKGKGDYGYHSGLAGIGDFFVFLMTNGKIPMMGGLGYGGDF